LQKNAAVTNQDQALAQQKPKPMQQINAVAMQINQDQLFAMQKQTLMQQTNVVATQINQDQVFATQKQTLMQWTNVAAMQTSQKLQQKAVTIAAASLVAVAAVMAAVDNLSI
jgi:hypothetical protein